MRGRLAQNWWVLVLRGIIGIRFGILAFAYPRDTIVALAIIFGAYMLADGVTALVIVLRICSSGSACASAHTVMRQGLILLLGRQQGLTIVGEASNGREAVEQFRKHRPDVLLIDIEMPLMDSITALAAIRSEYGEARGLLLTMHAREGDILRGLRAGVMGYVLKDAPLDTLLEAIGAVYAGRG